MANDPRNLRGRDLEWWPAGYENGQPQEWWVLDPGTKELLYVLPYGAITHSEGLVRA